jgi:hypothetical protein
MVAKGNVDKLLAGSEETIYLVTLKGNTETAYKNISEQPWINNIEAETKREQIKWQITVADENIAEEKLLRLILADKNIRVTDYRIKRYELEEIFLQVVEGDENV